MEGVLVAAREEAQWDLQEGSDLLAAGYEGPEFFNKIYHILGKFTLHEDIFSCAGMDKSEGLGVKCLSWENLETVVDELLVFGVEYTFKYTVPTISVIIEERVSYMVHMDTNLVCTTCFKLALNYCDITEPFKYPVVGNGVFAR